MPKIGAEPIRKAALINATITTVGRAGSLDVTVAQIAREAGMSTALAHYYFGSKDQIFLAAMRHILTDFRETVVKYTPANATPAERLDAIIRASVDLKNFNPNMVAAWMNFYVLAQVNGEAARLLHVYQRRLLTNLTATLRPLSPRAPQIAATLGALIDGAYLRAALSTNPADAEQALPLCRAYVEEALR